MITYYSLERQSIRKHQMLFWLTLLLLNFVPFILSAQPPVASEDCSRSLLEFDGSNDEVSVSIPNFSYVSGTIEAWVRKDNWQDPYDDALFSNGLGHTTANSFYLSFHPAVGLHFRYGNDGGAYVSDATAKSFEAGSWHHVAATWNNNGVNTDLSIFMDGDSLTSITLGNVVLEGPTIFGISKGATLSHYVLQGGAIADVRVWNVVRSETEIADNKDVLLTGSEEGLISYWPMNDGSGTSVSNMVTGAASGTMLNMDPNTNWINEFPIGISSGDIISKGGSYSFGTFAVDESSVAQIFTITNYSKDAIDLSTNPISALSGDNADQFDLDLTTTSSSLAAGASTTFTITFTPTSEGVKTALFSFANVSGCTEPYIINLSGIGSNMQGSINVDADVLIHGQSTGQLTASASGGVEPYSYLWSNGAVDATIINLAAGTYSVVVTDNIGATVTASAEVTQPSKLEVYVSVDSHVTSYGGDDGQLSASPSGGVDPYNYSWSNGSTSATNTGLMAGEHTVTITDANGATATASATVTQPLPLEVHVIVTNNLSGGNTSDGELNAYGQYGDKPYTFLWSTGATTSTISNLTAGTYSVTITDSNGQTDSESFDLGMDWNASITYYGPGFTETTANDGELKGSITAQLKGDLFNGTDGMLEDNAVTVTSVNGLTAEVEVTELDTIAKTWTKLSVSSIAPDYLYSIGYVNDRFIAYGLKDGQSTIYLSNGEGWIKNTVSNRTWVSFGYALGKYVALSYDGYTINSTDGTYWSEEEFLTDCNWSGIAFGNGIFVAVASGHAESAVMVSEDGVNWDDPTTLINKSWQSVLFVEGRFIAVSSGGDIMTSTDGQSWSLTENLIGSDYVEDMVYGNGVYVAVTGDTDGEIWQSSNGGVTWTQQHSELYVEWEQVEYGAGSFVTISHDGSDVQSLRSIDGITWNEVLISDNSLSGIAYGQGQFLVSVDNSGKDWFYQSEHSAKAELTYSGNADSHLKADDLDDIVFNFTDDAFASLDNTEVANSVDASSGIGISFIKDPSISYSGAGFMEVVEDNGAVEGSLFITLSGDNFSAENLEIDNHVILGNVPEGLDPTISVTSDHSFITDWNNSTDESIVNTYIAAAYGDSVFVAITGGTDYLYSEDGINWSEKTFSQSDWSDITYGNGRFVAVGQSDFVITSTDGDYWSYHSVEGYWNSITYGNGIFVAVGEDQTMTSTDGVEWTVTDDDTYTDWLAVAYGNGVFVSVGPYEEDLMYSSNGSDWIHLDLAISDGFEDITFGNDVFVAVSNNGFVLTSSNGSDWDQYSIPSGNWNSISYGGGEFLIVGDVYDFDSPEMLRSSSGTSWSGVYGIEDIDLNTSLYAQEEFYLFTGDSDQWLFRSSESQSVAELTFSGSANEHLVINSVDDITFEFSNNAFVKTSAENVLNATGPASSDLGIAFHNIIEVVYSGPGFKETADNDGSVTGSLTITMINDTFQDNDEDNVLDLASELDVYIYPYGLTPLVSLVSPSEAVLTFSGQASNHSDASDISELILNFKDAAFTTVTAAEVKRATGFTPSGYGIDFKNNPSITYSGDGFKEVEANDGSVVGSILIDLKYGAFQDMDEDGLIDSGNEVVINSIPAGLTPSLEITENSVQGINWEVVESITMDYNSVAYGNGVYVAVGSSGTDRMATSNDGITWTLNSGYDDLIWYDVVFAEGLFVALPYSGSNLVYTSIDGINWTERAPSSGFEAGSEAGWSKLTYGGGLFMAVRPNGDNKVLISEDGIDWTLLTGGEAMGDFLGYGQGLFISGKSDGAISVSSDKGVTWETVSFGENIFYGMSDMAYGNGTFVITSIYSYEGDDENNNLILTSSDGLNWTPVAVEQSQWSSVAFGNGSFVAVATGGTNRVMTSVDGTSWTAVTVPEVRWLDVIFANERFTTIARNVGSAGVMHSETKAKAELTLSGSATDHQYASSISDITFEFADAAFVDVLAGEVLNATGPASSGLGITFDPVANDNCEAATELTVYAKGTGSYIVESTTNANTYNGNIYCSTTGEAKDLWYKIHLGESGNVELSLILGTAKKLSGAVYTQCGEEAIYCVDSLPEKLFLPIGSDMDLYLQVWTDEENAGTFTFRANEAPTAWTSSFFGSYWSGGAPEMNDDAIILTRYHTTYSGSLEVNDLEIYLDSLIFDGTLNIADGDALIVNGDLENNGGLYVASGGSLVTHGEVYSRDYEEFLLWDQEYFVGTLINRNTTFDNTTGRYSIVGSPVQEGSFDSLGANARVYAYDESAPYNPFGNQGLSRFKTPTQLELVSMKPGKGYFSAFTGDENGSVWFTGTPNYGDINMDLSYTDQGNTDEVDYQGFNLLSNPYPAAISASAFFDGNSSVDYDGSVYLWDDFGSDTERGSNADYFVVNTLGNTNSRADGEEKFDGYIRSAQGFFVKANSSGQTLQFNDEMKVSGNNSDGGYYRVSTPETYKIQITGEASSKATVLGFVNDATTSRDKGYDAQLMSSGLELYTIQPSDDQKLSIQGLPKSFSEEIALGFSSEDAGVYTIGLSNSENAPSQLWLRDLQTDKEVDLTLDKYTFSTLSGEFNGRFVLTRSRVLGYQDKAPSIYVYEKTLYIPQDKSTSEKQLIDVSGRKVMTIPAGTQSVNLSSLTNGVYIVADGIQNQKIILN